MQQKSFDNGGVLFTAREKKGPTSPDYRGNVRISREMLDYLIDQMENGQPLTLTLFGYNRQGNNGRFIGLSPAIPMEQRESVPVAQRGYGNQQGRSYQRPPQNNYQNNYRQQSGGGYGQQGGRTDFRPQRQSASQREASEQQAMQEFQRGDRMPDFGNGDRDEKLPWED
jgi:hypothetical protein